MLKLARVQGLCVSLVGIGLLLVACGADDSSPTADAGDTSPPESVTSQSADTSQTSTTEATGTDPETTSTEVDRPVVLDGRGVTVGIVYGIGGRSDQTFYHLAGIGLDQAADDLGVDRIEATVDSASFDREGLLIQHAQSSDLVITFGSDFTEPVVEAARANPATDFAIVDASASDVPNLAKLGFANEEGSFLMGVAAALTSKTGKVGFLGSVNMDVIETFQAGFEAGARAAKPDIALDARYVSEFPDLTGFGDPAGAQRVAQAMYEDGVDVIYHETGGAGSGVFQAAAGHSAASETKVWAIGSHSDEYVTADPSVRDYILTSMVKRYDVAVRHAIEAHLSDDIDASFIVLDLSVNGMDYSVSGGFVDDIAAQIDGFSKQIIDGDIEVPNRLDD